MASDFTVRLNLEKPGNNDFVDTWDAVVNANMDLLDAAIWRLPVVAADPPSPANGEIWLRGDLGELRAHINGTTRRLTLAAV